MAGETSAPLRRRQAEALGEEASWANSLAEIPPGAPLLLVANELLDCLPAQQFFRTPNGWAERMVGLGDDGELRFGLSPGIAARPPIDGPEGAIWELSPAQSALGGELGARVAADGGAALLIDYGRDAPGFGDTLQALRAHSKESPLASPGEADLTVHVDFPAVLSAARRAGAQTAPILNQSDFLRRLGLEARAQALTAAHPDRAAVIERQVHRLVARDQMGSLFKVACVHSIGIAPAGFEPSQ